MNDMGNVRPLGIRCNHKIREYSCCIYVGSVHARSLTRAHTCTVMYMSAGRFLHSPGHDCICKSVRSGQYCMADTIASDTGHNNANLMPIFLGAYSLCWAQTTSKSSMKSSLSLRFPTPRGEAVHYYFLML